MGRLLRGWLVWQGVLSRFCHYIIQAFVTGVGIIALLATFVGLDYDRVGPCGYVARAHDVAVERSGDME